MSVVPPKAVVKSVQWRLPQGRLGQHSAKMQSQGTDLLQPSLLSRPNLVERFFNKIKQCRRVATRYDKLAANYFAFIQLGCMLMSPRRS
jgi:transposase